jgi:hypothetical protein
MNSRKGVMASVAGRRRGPQMGRGRQSVRLVRTPGDQDRFMGTTRVNGPADPLAATRDIVVTKRVLFRLTLAAGTVDLTPARIAGHLPAIPAGLEYRIQKASFYAAAANDSFLSVDDLTSDLASFSDFGTQGSVRPQVHLVPALELRQTWIPSGATGPVAIYHIASAPVTGTIVVSLTLEIRLRVLTPP